MPVPWEYLAVLVAPAIPGAVYCFALKVSGRAISLRVLVFEVGALVFLVLGWVVLLAVGAAGNPLGREPACGRATAGLALNRVGLCR
jgi:hypothetical protein